MDVYDWPYTKKALEKLGGALECGVCDKLLQEPCTLGSCDHLFCRSCVNIYLGNTCPVCHAPAWVKDLQLKRELASVVTIYEKLCTVVNHDECRNTEEAGVAPRVAPNNKSLVSMKSQSPSRKAPLPRNPRNVSPRAQVEGAQSPKKFGKKLSKTGQQEQIRNEVNGKHSVIQKNERNKTQGTSSSSSDNELMDPMSVYDFIPSPKRPKHAAKKRLRKPNPKAIKKQRVAAANRKWFRRSLPNKTEDSESGFDSERSVRHVSFSIDTDLSRSSVQDSSSIESMDVSSQDEILVPIGNDCSAAVSSTQESGYATGSTPLASSLCNKQGNLSDSNEVNTSPKDARAHHCSGQSRPFKKTTKKILEALDTSARLTSQTEMHPPATRTSKRKAARSSSEAESEDPDFKKDKMLNMSEGNSSKERCVPEASQVSQKPPSDNSSSQIREVTETDAPSSYKMRSRNHESIKDDNRFLNRQEEMRSLRSSSKSDRLPEKNLETSQASRRNVKQDSRKGTNPAATQQQIPRKGTKKSPQKAEKRQVQTPTSSEKLHNLRHTKPLSRSNCSTIKRNKRGETPLHIAAIKGNIDASRRLLVDGANPNVKDNAGWTPLHEACNHGHSSIVTLLLDYSALINTPGFEHDSPLHDAVMNHRLDVVKLLLERGASLDVRNKHGLTPADYAKSEPMKKALKTKSLVTIETTNMAAVTRTSSQNLNQSVVLLGTGLKDPERKQLHSCAKLLGGRVVSEFGPDVTHLVASCNHDDLCLRTIKYLNAILTGVWVVSLKWVKECLRTKGRASEVEYEVKGTLTLPLSSGAKKGRRNAEQQLPGLLDGCHFYLYSTFSPPTPSKPEIIQLIRNGGGTVLTRQPKPDDDIIQASLTIPYHARPQTQLATCSHYIIHDHNDGRAPPKVRTGKLCTAPVSWLMDCISQFELLDLQE